MRLLMPGEQKKRYLATAVTTDGCSRKFAAVAHTLDDANRMLAKHLGKHWPGYVVESITETTDVPGAAVGVGSVDD